MGVNIKLKVLFSGLVLSISFTTNALADFISYAIVDTGQQGCYGNSTSMQCPKEGENFHGQDGQYHGNQPSYRDNGDGTITDSVTGLMWQKTPSTTKTSYSKAQKDASNFELAGYDDWRLPTIKELYSLIDCRGQTGNSANSSIPYINTDFLTSIMATQERVRESLIASFGHPLSTQEPP